MVCAYASVLLLAPLFTQIACGQQKDSNKERPSFLMASLLTTTVVLQGLDVHSTVTALNAGAVERNVLMRPITANRPTFIGVKAAATVFTIRSARKLSKEHRLRTVITLMAIDSAYAFIVVKNYRLAGRLR